MFHPAARVALTGFCAPALLLTLAACDSSSPDAGGDKPTAEATQAAAAPADTGASAARSQADQQSLEQFYAGDAADDTGANDADASDDDTGPDAPAAPPPPARSAPDPMPVGPPNPVPQ